LVPLNQVINFVKQHPHLSLEWLACLNKGLLIPCKGHSTPSG
ncbi:hypothetical protein WJX79_003438, partial [Trebouxia sp. C0005]